MIYLDNAATTAKKPRCVYKGIQELYNNGASAGRGGYKAALFASEAMFETRSTLADFFHVESPERIVFAQNTTQALNTAIRGILTYGDHVIFSSMEHNSVVRPIKMMEQEKKITVSMLSAEKDGTVDVENLRNLIRPETKLICLTHSSNVCGAINDIKKAQEIAREKNVYLLVDAAQSAGTIDICAKEYDMVAFPGHKGLMGPFGTGGLYVREEIILSPLLSGGTGSLSENLLQPDIMPDRLESGTQNVSALFGLKCAVDFIHTIGIETIRQKEESLLKMFEERVRNMPNVTVYGNDNKTAICALNISGKDCVEVAQILDEKYDIAVRSGLHCAYLAHKTLGTEKTGTVRFSFGFFNTPKEVLRAADALYEISKGVIV